MPRRELGQVGELELHGASDVEAPRCGASGYSEILPVYLRRTRNVEELPPWLYLKGVSTGQFEEALAVLSPVSDYS